ncbi:acyl-coenzyme A thioesterase 9, mitochondrial-like [Calliphora vicina]|uniref:acyl-coenzyme A thioesterase 9, mitochondrial-like n=1 Tax=Calliphora vicina TaxID=7373 RepID=UPI00325A9B6B
MLKTLKFLGNCYYNKKYVNNSILLKLVTYSSSANIGLKNDLPKKSGTMKEVNLKIMQRLGLETGYIREAENREHLLKYTPLQQELPVRSMKDSYMEAYIPLSICADMQVNYVSPVGTVRLGRLMEQLDMFAVWICQQHVLLPKLPANEYLPYTFVTVLVDKMMFSKLLPLYNQDIRLTGHVSWVGRTSLEISVWLEQKHQDNFRQITQAVFLMAARNATNTQAAPINPLEPSNEQEREIFNLGEERRKIRKRLHETSIFKIKPSEEEHSLMYDLFQKTTNNTHLQLNNRFLPSKCRWMNDSFIVNTFLSFPENRNAQNTVFGGFLMRQSYEISWMRAYLYCGQRPTCERCCDISFEKPVQMGSIIKMIAYVVYTEDRFMQIMTVAELLDASGEGAHTTNTFYYTFSCGHKVTVVLPKSYHETMWYIHGRRKFYYAMDKVK